MNRNQNVWLSLRLICIFFSFEGIPISYSMVNQSSFQYNQTYYCSLYNIFLHPDVYKLTETSGLDFGEIIKNNIMAHTHTQINVICLIYLFSISTQLIC